MKKFIEKRKSDRRSGNDRRVKLRRLINGEKLFDNNVTIDKHTILNSIKRAFKGFIFAFKIQRNFLIEIIIFICILILGLIIQLPVIEFIIIIFTGFFVLVSEIINTSIEFMIDETVGNNFKVRVKKIKDIAAGAVLVSCIFAIIVAIIIFIPKIF